MNQYSDGLIVVIKRDCPTCALLTPVYSELSQNETPVLVVSQDDPAFPENIEGVIDDTDLEQSYRLNIETVPRKNRFRYRGPTVNFKQNKAEWM